jgi:FtsZ-interacting cell division protein ZipA
MVDITIIFAVILVLLIIGNIFWRRRKDTNKPKRVKKSCKKSDDSIDPTTPEMENEIDELIEYINST